MKLKSIALIISGASVLAACGGDGTVGEVPSDTIPVNQSVEDPSLGVETLGYNDVPVHDPSVIRDDDGTFYVVGSHLAMAKSSDLVSWEQVAPGIALENPDFATNPLFSNYDVEVAEGIEWTGGYAGSWASDIIKLPDGRYYFYYNHCTQPSTGVCDGPRSYLGVAVSDTEITGPYEDLGIFLRSGQTDAEIEQGYGVGEIESFNGSVHPNTIDPDTFYDKEGNLWMLYGSYSGGIYILEMDEETAKPKPGQGYGKHLIGGDHSSIEGSYMLYSPESDYYYLFTSFGGFEANDGYNIRIARSRNPDGPFVDAEGKNVADARGGWDSIAPYGVKLMGGFEFTSPVGDEHDSRGYLAPGHNSAYYDEETGQHFLITHTRFPSRGEGHAIRVHEMFINSEGWLVASPHRYAPIDGENVVDAGDLVGDFQVVLHGKDINREAKQSLYVTMTEDREITGDLNGYYRLYDDEPARITLYVDGVAHEGVTRWQWDDRTGQMAPVVSALSPEGGAVWATRLPEKSNSEVMAAIAEGLTLPEEFKGDAIELPTVGARGAQITWASSNERIIKANGAVTRPNVGEGDQMVTLTATINRSGAEITEDFTVLIPEREPFNRLAYYDFEGDLSETLGNLEAGQSTGDRIWKVGEGSVSYTAGQEGQALVLDGTSGVRLPEALIENYEYTVSMWLNPQVLTGFSPAFFGAVNEQEAEDGTFSSNNWISLVPQSWDGNTMLWSGSEAWLDGTAGEIIPADTWSHVAFSVNRGLVKVFINGVEKFSSGNLTDFFTERDSVFALGVNYWDVPFNGFVDELKVYEAALTGGEVTALDVEQWPSEQLLDSAVSLLDLGNTSAVQSDIELPLTGPYASAISWTSSNPSVIEVDGATGVVTRPGRESSNADVTLTATVALEGETQTREFAVTVMSLAPPEPVAIYSFDDHLDDLTGRFGPGQVTGNRIGNTGGVLVYGEGKFGSAVQLDGTYGVKLANNLLTDSTYSIVMWLNPTTLNQFTPAFFGAATESSWISVVPHGPGDAGNTMLWSGTAWFDGNTGTQIETGVWTHFAAVNNGGNITLYLNGEEVFNSGNFPDVFTPASTTQFAVGVNFWDVPYTGLMDDLVIFDEPLSAEDVNNLMEGVEAP